MFEKITAGFSASGIGGTDRYISSAAYKYAMSIYSRGLVSAGKSRRKALSLLGVLLFCTGVLHAQSLSVVPSNYPTVVVGGTMQFTAVASGFNISSIKWEVGSLQGGSAANGTITTGLTGGLYTGPATIPGQNPQTIMAVATGTNGSKYSATSFVTILPPPPVITSVSPNPLPSGSTTVTVTGTGFSSNSRIWDGGVQYATQQPAANTLTASVYTSPASTSATFTVNDTGSVSNAIIVPVGSSPVKTFMLSVVGGSGSGNYAAGSVVTISASAAPAGQQFQSWSGATVASAGKAVTTLTMPAANTTVTAGYGAAAPASFTLSVVGGTGSGSYAAGAVVNIAATAPSGQQFQSWSGATVASAGSSSTTLAMPAANTIVTAQFVATPVLAITSVSPNPLPAGTTTVTINGTGFTPGSIIWDGGVQYATQAAGNTLTASVYTAPGTASATFTVNNMGPVSNAVTVPVAGPPSYTLTVAGGTGSGSYAAGTVVVVTANAPPAGETFADWTGAAVSNSNASSTTITMPAGGTTLTANFTQSAYMLTILNGTGSGAYAAGTVVPISASAAPAGEYFQVWTGPGLANGNQPSTTVTMPQANTTVTAGFYTPAPVPFPVTTHPRLWITQQDLPHLQAWAGPGNPAYQGQSGALATAIGNYATAFQGAAPGAANPTAASPYPDLGDTNGYIGMLSEEDAAILALNSLIDPIAANRANYGQAARNLLMYVMNQAAQGPASGVPFRDPSFSISNRASWAGHLWPLVVDWIYPSLSATDKATIRSVFITWANQCLTASTTGGDNPGAPGLENSVALLTFHGQPGAPYRMASNNYFLAHARLLTMMSLAFDPADDAPVNPALPPSALGNTLRSYIADATGAWLYEEFAMMGDPQAVGQAYNIPNNPAGTGFGLASGGLPPEGMLYGESYAYILGQLLALQTAGFNSTSLSGPQIGLIGAPVWDRYMTGYLSSLTPAAKTFASESYLGSLFQYASYGDLLRLYVTPDQMAPWALLGLLDQQTGTSAHVNASRWFVLNAMPDGAAGLLTRMSNPWTWGVTQDLLYYMFLDPAAAAPVDPRPAFPTTFYDAPAGRIVAHSDWTLNGTMFDYKAGWISINHQDGNGGQFEFFRKGEWLTKEMSNYDGGGIGNGQTVTYHNTLGLQNWCSICAGVNWLGMDLAAWTNGGQWMGGENIGDPTTTMSTGAGYTYANSDLTNLYNKPTVWTPTAMDTVVDIAQATRSILWLNNDYIVVYDRATSAHNGFKRFNLSLVANPVVSGNTATETLPDGQQLFIRTLLPLNPSLTGFNESATLNSGALADLEPTRFVYQVQDPALPLDTRFLHVLQGADPGAPVANATYLQSSGASAFDGAQFGAGEVWFPVSAKAVFGGATFPAPAGVHSVLVTGLLPNTGYSVNIQAAGGGNTVSVLPGGSNATTDAGGVLQLSF